MMNLFYVFLVGTVFYISTALCQHNAVEFNTFKKQVDEAVRDIIHYFFELCKKSDIPSYYIINEKFSSAYKYYQIPLNWNDARRNCEDDGAHLAIINSKDELEYLKTLRRNPHARTWIGYHKLFSKETIEPSINWTTVLNQTANLDQYWAFKQPDHNNERCVAIGRRGLNNLNCELNYKRGVSIASICEINC